MANSSTRMTAGLMCSCVFFVVATVLLTIVGISGVRSATATGQSIVRDELMQAAQAGDVGRAVVIVYSTSQALMLSTDPVERAQTSGALHEQMIPAVQESLTALRQARAADSPADLATITSLTTSWNSLRGLLDSPLLATTGTAQQASLAQISAAFHKLTGQLDAMSNHENQLAVAATATSQIASAGLQRTILITAALVLLGIAINTLVAFRHVRQITRPAQQQAEFADTIQLARDEDEAQELLRKHLERTVTGGVVTVLNRNNSADRLQAVTALPPGSPLVLALEHAEPQSCLAVRSGRQHNEDQRRPALLGCPLCSTCPGRSSCLPLTVGGEVIGAVLVNRPTSRKPMQQVQVREAVGQAAPVLANLRNLAIAELRAATDSLTGLPNKRAVGDTLKRMLAQASRSSLPMALLMLDLDHFKNINDRFGHPVGDQALAGVGAALRSTLRDSDFSGRNGGEEFTVILPGTDVECAVVSAERIRSAIAEIVIPGVDVHLTASVGIAVYPTHGIGTERLERLADSALYVAKRTGRNRVEVATPTTDMPKLEEDLSNGRASASALTLVASTPSTT